MLCCFNLLPIVLLDGGRVLRCTLSWLLGPQAAWRLCRWSDRLFSGAAAALGLFLLGAGAGPTLLLTALWLCCNLAQETRLCIKNPLRRNPHRRGRAA